VLSEMRSPDGVHTSPRCMQTPGRDPMIDGLRAEAVLE
jgi:hypothetical protein